MEKMQIEAKVENLDKVLAFVDRLLEEHECPMKTQIQIDVAIEEIFVNIASYAYTPGTGMAELAAEISNDGLKVSFTFTDSGIPYDPLAKEDPDITLSAEDRQIGGLGIFMVKNSMDDMTYRRENGKNILTITKEIS